MTRLVTEWRASGEPRDRLKIRRSSTLEAFVSYGTSVGGFPVSTGSGGWSYTAANDITMLATAADASLVAKTMAIDGTDTILRFPAGGGLATSTMGVANISHVVKDLWTTSNPSGAAGPLEGENIDWATTGWFQPSSGGSRRVRGVYRDRPGVPGHQDAAFDLMEELRPLATKHEWGGLICRSGADYSWSRFVTSGDPGMVNVLGQTSCDTQTTIADVHLHLLSAQGQTTPSGDDLNNANNHSALIFYLSAPKLDRTPGSQFIRYQGPNATANTCYWFGSWQRYTSAAGWIPCTTP
jgi:hypothetical protein